MSYQVEFPEYLGEDMPPVPAGMADSSWHNDTCPSYIGLGVHIFIDREKPEDRVSGGEKRFTVNAAAAEFDGGTILESDDWSEVLHCVANQGRTPAQAIGLQFAWILQNDVKPEDFAEMRRRNALEINPSVCHSHDFCDANIAMEAAFRHENLHGIADPAGIDGSAALWHDAWREAMPYLCERALAVRITGKDGKAETHLFPVGDDIIDCGGEKRPGVRYDGMTAPQMQTIAYGINDGGFWADMITDENGDAVGTWMIVTPVMRAITLLPTLDPARAPGDRRQDAAIPVAEPAGPASPRALEPGAAAPADSNLLGGSETHLQFDTNEVRKLVQHTLSTQSGHRPAYRMSERDPDTAEPGLLLAKDEGIYLMSNANERLPGAGNYHYVVYADGYDPRTGDVWDKCRDAVGGDDFAELLPIGMFSPLVEQTKKRFITLAVTPEEISVEAPPPASRDVINHAGRFFPGHAKQYPLAIGIDLKDRKQQAEICNALRTLPTEELQERLAETRTVRDYFKPLAGTSNFNREAFAAAQAGYAAVAAVLGQRGIDPLPPAPPVRAAGRGHGD